ncbi:hypothetical protein [Nesterenkonia sp.]|uniref:hypothetical protein n=1 Tax=Nesterenkonia sp. TaxID=704201 RepID=UPI0026308790|nr:hypothetical protein [Nesterenkonia sp.]
MRREQAQLLHAQGELAGSPEIVPVPHVEDETGARLCVRVTPPAAALAETIPDMPVQEAVTVLDAASAGRWSADRPMSLSDLEAAGGMVSTSEARRRWEILNRFADPRAESPGESRSRVLIAQLGFACPRLQEPIPLGRSRTVRVDFYWPEAAVVGEFDGRMKYLRSGELSGLSVEEVVYQEKLREDGLRERGLRVARWGWDELAKPERLAAKLRRAGVPQRDPSTPAPLPGIEG